MPSVPTARRLWAFTAGNSLWTTPAFAADGSSFWGSLDLNIYRLDRHRPTAVAHVHPRLRDLLAGDRLRRDRVRRRRSTRSCTRSTRAPARSRWSFETSDHIYASPALGQDARGHTNAIYIASANGSVYELSPAGAAALALRHRRRRFARRRRSGCARRRARRASSTSAPQREAVRDEREHRAPALVLRHDAEQSGSPRPQQPQRVAGARQDRRLHRRRGRLRRLRALRLLPAPPRPSLLDQPDARSSATTSTACSRSSAGGSTLAAAGVRSGLAATVINLRLIVRRHGSTVNAAMLDPDRLVTRRPRVRVHRPRSRATVTTCTSCPDGFLRPGTTYRAADRGHYTDNGTHMGNFNAHGPRAGSFAQTITVRTAPRRGSLPLKVGRDAVGAMTISRLSVPMPSFLASVNQIGFDSYDWIASTIARTKHHVLLWVVGALPAPRRSRRGRPAQAPSRSRSPAATRATR